MMEREYDLKPPSREPGQVKAGGGAEGRNMAPEQQVEGPGAQGCVGWAGRSPLSDRGIGGSART